MPTPVESLLEVYEDMVEDLLVLEIFLAKDLLYGVSSCFEACLFFSAVLLCMRLQSVRNDLQHNFVRVTGEANCSVVLGMLQAAFLGKCDD